MDQSVSEDSDTALDSQLLSKLSHPLRQQILVIIEQEGRVGYKRLKDQCQTTTGTLYYHLKMLVGLIEQDAQRQYRLTQEGEQALSYLFRDQLSKNSLFSSSTASPTSVTSTLDIQRIKIKSLNYSLFHLQSSMYLGMMGMYVIFLLIRVFLSPKIVFIHFLSFSIDDSSPVWWYFLPLVWLVVTVICLIVISWLTKQTLSLSALAWLTIYHSTVELIMIIVFIFPVLNSNLILLILSFILQGFFLVIFPMILVGEFFTWERAFLLGLLLNYFILLLILL